MKDTGNTSVARRRRRDGETLNQVAGTPATVPTATGDIRNPVGSLASEPTHDDIARRAYLHYEGRGGEQGHDWDDWFQAERELRQGAPSNVVDSIVENENAFVPA